VLNQEQIRTLFADMWNLHQIERMWLDRIYDYVAGVRGIPGTPDGAPEEINELARLSVKNVLTLVRDSFTQNLSVIGYKTALAKDNGPAWDIWQRNRMDARQAEVYRPAITYGASYVTVMKDEDTGKSVWRTRSPRQLLAVYEEPSLDLWPQYAMEMWIDQTDAKAKWRGRFYDDTYIYPITLGGITVLPLDQYAMSVERAVTIQEFGAPVEHGADVCPVIRFVNDRDADDQIIGEIGSLIRDQQAINSVNFDRLIVSRFGAFPQKVITGWAAGDSDVLQASAKRVWAFDDDTVRATSFPPASLDQYNGILAEMTEAVALKAQISPSQITGKLVNVSAEALAAAEANQQRKLAAKRDSFGESWEQCFRLASELEGDAKSAKDDASEVQWRDTEARAFAAIVDGVVKLTTAGIPIEELLPLIPGLTQQQQQGIKNAIRAEKVNGLVAALSAPPPPPPGAPQPPEAAAPGRPPTPAAMPQQMKAMPQQMMKNATAAAR
jgi:Phage portal protein, SPP1 Gp6-like